MSEMGWLASRVRPGRHIFGAIACLSWPMVFLVLSLRGKCLAQVTLLLSYRSQDLNFSSVVLGCIFFPTYTLPHLPLLWNTLHASHWTWIYIILKWYKRFYELRSTEIPREAELLNPNFNINNCILFIQFQILFSWLQYLPLFMYVQMWLYVNNWLIEFHFRWG